MNKSYEPIKLKNILSGMPWGDARQKYAEAIHQSIQVEGSVKKLARKTNVSISTIYRIRKQKVYKLTDRVYGNLFESICPFLPNEHYMPLVSRDDGRECHKKEFIIESKS